MSVTGNFAPATTSNASAAVVAFAVYHGMSASEPSSQASTHSLRDVMLCSLKRPRELKLRHSGVSREQKPARKMRLTVFELDDQYVDRPDVEACEHGVELVAPATVGIEHVHRLQQYVRHDAEPFEAIPDQAVHA